MHLLLRVVRDRVSDHRDLVTELGCEANGRFDAGMRDEADDDELMDAVLLELQIEIGVGKATGAPMLRGDNLARLGLEPGTDLATPGAVLEGLAHPCRSLDGSNILPGLVVAGTVAMMQCIEDAQLRLPRGFENLQHMRNTIIGFRDSPNAVPDLAPFGDEVVVGIEHQKAGDLLFVCHLCHSSLPESRVGALDRRSIAGSIARIEDSLGQLVRAFFREKVTAPIDRDCLSAPLPGRNRTALHAVSEHRDRRAQRVAHPVGSAERQNGHRQSLGGARLRLLQARRIEIFPVPGETGPHRSGRGILPRILFDGGRIDGVGSFALRREDPGEIGAFASLDQHLRQIVEPIECKLPALQVRCFARDSAREGGDSRNVRFGHHQPLHVRGIVHGVGMRDPRPYVMGDDVDPSRAREIGRLQKTMQVACGGIEIITAGRLVALTEAARVQHDNAPARADQHGQDLAPGDPALRPPWKQQDRSAGPRRHVVEARAVDRRDMVLDLVGTPRILGHGARREQSSGGGHGGRLDDYAHCVLPLRSAQRDDRCSDTACSAGRD